jgi:hypothetical protein
MRFKMCLLTVAVLSTTTFAMAQQVHPRLKAKEFAIESVAVMPVRVEMNRSGMKGGEGMSEVTSQLITKLQSAVESELRARKAKAFAATRPVQEQDDAAKNATADVQQKFDSLYTQLAKKPKDIAQGRFTMGDSVAEFHPTESAQVLAFVRAAGQVPTKGKMGFGMLVAAAAGGAAGSAVMGPNAFIADVTFVDAKSGEVLALASLRTTGSAVAKTVSKEDKTLNKSVDKTLAKAVSKAFKKLPIAGEKQKS